MILDVASVGVVSFIVIAGADPEFAVKIHECGENRPEAAAVIAVRPVPRHAVRESRVERFAFVGQRGIRLEPAQAAQGVDAANGDDEFEGAGFGPLGEDTRFGRPGMFVDIVFEFFQRRDQLPGNRCRQHRNILARLLRPHNGNVGPRCTGTMLGPDRSSVVMAPLCGRL